MSDYDDSRQDMSDDEENEEESRGDIDESEEDYENNKKELQQYNSDGLTEAEYKESKILRGQLTQAECCRKFFSQEGYVHKIKYGLNFAGLNTCVHCYFRLNDYKFGEKSDITQQEIECLKYYINNFVEEHQPAKCSITNFGGKCILCDAVRGVYPLVIAKDMIAIDEIVNDNSIMCDIDNDDIYNDIKVIKQNNTLPEQSISQTCLVNTSDPKNIKKNREKSFVLIL